MAFKVIKIVNEYTVMVTPEWRVWKHKMGGCLVRASDYNISTKADVRRDAKKILRDTLMGKSIELKNVSGISGSGTSGTGVLRAEIWFEGQSVAKLMSGLKAGKAPKAKAVKAEAEPVAEIAAESN